MGRKDERRAHKKRAATSRFHDKRFHRTKGRLHRRGSTGANCLDINHIGKVPPVATGRKTEFGLAWSAVLICTVVQVRKEFK